MVDPASKNSAEVGKVASAAGFETDAVFQALANQVAAGVVRADAQGRLSSVNRRFCELLGCGETELVGVSLHSLVDGDSRGEYLRRFGQLQVDGHPFQCELQLLRRNGEPFWVSLGMSAMPQSPDAQMATVALVIDISAQRAAEQARRQSDEKLRTIIDTMSEGYALIELIYDAQGRAVDFQHLEVNDAEQRLTGLQGRAGQRMSQVAPLEDYWLRFYEQVASTGGPARMEGRVESMGRWFRVQATRIGQRGSKLLIVTYDDISERKRREQQHEFLLRLGDTLRPLVDPIDMETTACRLLSEYLQADHVYYAWLDEGQRRWFVEREYASGTPPRTMLGAHLRDDFGWVMPHFARGRPVVVDDVHQSGLVAPVEIAAMDSIHARAVISVPLSKDGTLVGALSATVRGPRSWTPEEVEVVRETLERTWAAVERSKARQGLRESEAKNRAFVQASSDSVYEMSADWSRVKSLSGRQFVDMSEGAREDWTDKYLPDDEKPRVWAAIHRAIETRSVFELEHRVIRFDGTEGWTSSRAIPLFDEHGSLLKWFGTASDISDRKRREANSAFLDQLGKDLAWVSQPDEILRIVGERLRDMLGLSACAFADVNEAQREFIVRYGWSATPAPLPAGTYRLDELHVGDEFARTCRAGETFVVHDTAHDPRIHATAHAALNIGAFVVVPYRRSEGWIGFCSFKNVQARQWRPDEIELLQELSGRIFWRIEHARVEAALRQNFATFSALIENAPLGVYLVDEHFRLRSINAGSQAVFRNVHPLLGRDLAEILRLVWPEPFASETIEHIRHTLATGIPYLPAPTTERRADVDAVESYDWQVHPVTLPDGTPGVVCYFYDLSEQQRLQDALVQADRRKDEFLAILAHELRNPLAPIRTSVEIMKHANDREAERRARDVIERQTDTLVRLVDDLLDVSRITSGKIRIRHERFTLTEVIDFALEASHPIVEQQHHTIEIDLPETPVWLSGDRLRLGQAFLNLLSNAAKYTPAQGHIRLQARCADGTVEVHVRDNGTGIAPESLHTLFDLFSRIERDRGQPGLGIGLYLVRQVIELHGGTVQARSEGPGRGSDFVVRLPVATDAAEALSGPVDAVRPSSGRRVMLVDDYEEGRETMAVLLRALGHEVITASDGEEALKRIPDFSPSLIILDIDMPRMNGYEVAAQIKADPRFHALKLVALTGYSQPDDFKRTKAAGFSAHLVKPVSLDRLKQVLSQVPDEQ